MTRVLGIDPGTRLCGWGLVEAGPKPIHVDNGVVVLPAGPLAPRLAALADALDEVIQRYQPEACAVEGVFFNRNARAALTLGHARGVALMCAARAGMEVAEYTPQQVKKSVTGSGRADKTQVQHMITLRLELPESPQEDAADAVAVALCHAQHLALGPGPAPPPRPRGGKRKADAALEALVKAQQKGRRS